MVGAIGKGEIYAQSGEAEAIVIIKAAPQVSQKHGETVCCAAIDLYGNWLRLYPISFRSLDESRRFSRWHKIAFKWRKPKDDLRLESRRVDQGSIYLTGELRKRERPAFLNKLIATSLNKELELGRSLALLQAEIMEFLIEEKSREDFDEETRRFSELRRQNDLFSPSSVVPYEPCPYRFKYRYRTNDGVREGTCQDWETEATYFYWKRKHGPDYALENMYDVFGEKYPKEGMLLAMGTHSRWPNTWLINGIIKLDEITQPTLF